MLRLRATLRIRDRDTVCGVRLPAMSALRKEPGRAFAFRSAADWRRTLTAAGFEVEAHAAGEGTPFANVLLVGYRESKEARTCDRSARATSPP